MIKSTIKTDTTKQEYPDKTIEEIQAICDEMNEKAKQLAQEESK